MQGRDDVWVQAIAVDKTGSHHDTVLAAATASVEVFLTSMERSEWGSWLSGPFTKTVRRASRSQLDAAAGYEDLPVADRTVGGSRAVALVPTMYASMPRVFSRLQVAGTDLDRSTASAASSVAAAVRVVVLEDLTTGKASAQAAHALWMWVLSIIEDDPERVAEWHRAGMGVDLVWVGAGSLAVPPAGALVVEDAGRTEVEPGTVTAYALDVHLVS